MTVLPVTTRVATIDFHVTSECNQECPYCWGPQDVPAVGTRTARRIIRRICDFGVKRIVFTGGDPLKRADIGELLRYAKQSGLEVALSATGDELRLGFLRKYGEYIDLLSLPLDGSCEEISARTKKKGHFTKIMRDLRWLARFPHVDVKLGTPVTQKNIADVPNIARLIDEWARTVSNRVFYNIFQAFPRSMVERDWEELVVSDKAYAAMRGRIEGKFGIKINFLTHQILDRVYVMILPDGMLTVPSGPDYRLYGRFLDVQNLDETLASGDFDTVRHLRHAKGWRKKT